jgi:hypothetical protein
MEGVLSKLAKPEPLGRLIASPLFVHVFFTQLMALGKDVD